VIGELADGKGGRLALAISLTASAFDSGSAVDCGAASAAVESSPK
jgi:hypothetical protein